MKKQVGLLDLKGTKGPISSEDHDVEGLKELLVLRDRVATKWRSGTNDLLAARNVELLERIKSFESRVDSMLRIPVKPKDLKKRWAELLNDYERTLNQAVAYASRHLDIDHTAAA